MAKTKLVDTWYYDVKDLVVVDEKPRDPNNALKAEASANRKGEPLKVEDEDEDDEDEAPREQRLITRKVEVQVRLEKDTIDDGKPPYGLKEVKFVVCCDEPKFEYEGTDIAALKEAAWDYLTDKFKIKWENYYLVTVSHASDYGGGYSTGMAFSYKDVEKGTTWNGKELLREYTWGGKREIKVWPGRFADKNGRAVACIPVNDENTAALKEFAKRVDKLREMIRDTLKPEVIMATLQNLSGMALLPPAPEEDEVPEEAPEEAPEEDVDNDKS